MRALVTGGAGFIGHHLARRLLENGNDVSVLDDLSTGIRARIEPLRNRLHFVHGSILERETLDAAAEGVDVIFHLAAIPSVVRSFEQPLPSNDVNVTGTIEVVLAAQRQGVRRIVFAGSSSVYGVPAKLPCNETMTASPVSPYGVGKLAAEQYLHIYGQHLGVETVALRYFNVFGPGQDPDSEYAAVIPAFITAVLDGRRPTVNGKGDVTRDFTYVDNVVEANLLAAEADLDGPLTCNIACNTSTSLLDLLGAIGEAAGVEADPVFGPPRPGDIVHSLADISRAREHLGYKVAVPFAEGIATTVDWYRGSAQPS